MASKEDQSKQDDKFQSIKYIVKLHQQYDESLKEGEIMRQRLFESKKLTHDFKRWISNLPSEPSDEPKEKYRSIEDINLVSFSIPIRTYLEEEGNW